MIRQLETAIDVLAILDIPQRLRRCLPHLRVAIIERLRYRLNGGRRSNLSQTLDRFLA